MLAVIRESEDEIERVQNGGDVSEWELLGEKLGRGDGLARLVLVGRGFTFELFVYLLRRLS